MKKWEDYLYPNGVLKNKLNIKDFDSLISLEYELTETINEHLLDIPIKGN